MIYYTGIGSRRISNDEDTLLTGLGRMFANNDFVLYSGHADGSDKAFEKGVGMSSNPQNAVMWLPWENFNGELLAGDSFVVGDMEDGRRSMEKFHPNVDRLSKGGKALMSRNHYQIYGMPSLYPMVDFVVCCADTEKNNAKKIKGGTGHAIRLASDLGISWFNMRIEGDYDRLMDYVNTLLL